MRILGLSPSLVLMAPPEQSPRVALCPWRSSPARSLLVFPISVGLKEQGKPDWHMHSYSWNISRQERTLISSLGLCF